MEVNFENLLGQITSFIKSEATTETVVGKEFKLGEFSCVPIIKVSMGFGGGGGGANDKKLGSGEGAGVGAGVNVEPVGFLASRGEEIQFISSKSSKGLAVAFEKMPELLEKYLEHQSKQEEHNNKA